MFISLVLRHLQIAALQQFLAQLCLATNLIRSKICVFHLVKAVEIELAVEIDLNTT